MSDELTRCQCCGVGSQNAYGVPAFDCDCYGQLCLRCFKCGRHCHHSHPSHELDRAVVNRDDGEQ